MRQYTTSGTRSLARSQQKLTAGDVRYLRFVGRKVARDTLSRQQHLFEETDAEFASSLRRRSADNALSRGASGTASLSRRRRNATAIEAASFAGLGWHNSDSESGCPDASRLRSLAGAPGPFAAG